MSEQYKDHVFQVITDKKTRDLLDKYTPGPNKVPLSILLDMALSGGGGVQEVVFPVVYPNEIKEIPNASFILGVSGEATVNTALQETTFNNSDEWVAQNLKYQIWSFIVDTANTSGHFVDHEGARVSVGTGPYNNIYVVPHVAMRLTGVGETVFIDDIVDPSADDGVVFKKWDSTTFTLPVGTYAVEVIYGACVNEENLFGELNNGKASIVQQASIKSHDFTLVTNPAHAATNCSVRMVIPNSLIVQDGSKVRVTLTGGVEYVKFKHVSIGKRIVGEFPQNWDLTRGPDIGNPPIKSTDSDKGPGTFSVQFQGQPSFVSTMNHVTIPITSNGAGYDWAIKAKNSGAGETIRARWSYFDNNLTYYFNFFLGDYEQTDNPGSDHEYVFNTLTSTYAVCNGPHLPPEFRPNTGAHSVSLQLFSESSDTFVEDTNLELTGIGSNIISNNDFTIWTPYPGYDTIQTPAEIKFNGESGVTILANESATSDFVDIAIDETADYLLILDFDSDQVMSANEDTGVTNGNAYVWASTSSYNSSTMGSLPNATLADTIIDLSKIEIVTTYAPVCSQPYALYGVVNQTVAPTIRDLYDQVLSENQSAVQKLNQNFISLFVSFNGGLSWKIWSGPTPPPSIPANTWVPLVSSLNSDHGGVEGDWYYRDISNPSLAWVQITDVSKKNAASALSLCIGTGDPSGVMSKDSYEQEADLSGPGGQTSGSDIRYALIFWVASDSDYASVEELDYRYTVDFTLMTTFGFPTDQQPNAPAIFVYSYETGSGPKTWKLQSLINEEARNVIVKYLP